MKKDPGRSGFRIRDISISKKLYFIVGIMAVLIAMELFTLYFSIHILSSVRAFVGAEGLWSKAQKDAVSQLESYNRTRNEEDYQQFLTYMKVSQGDHIARMELLKPEPDMDIVRSGFTSGRIHPDDIDGMAKLVLRFHSISYIHDAMTIWAKGDSLITGVAVIGERMHTEVRSGNPSEENMQLLVSALHPVNRSLTELEDDFSSTLSAGSRWLEHIILRILFLVALTVEITGLILTVSVSRNISRGLNEIKRAAQKIAKGDLTERAVVFSKDEIGSVAVSMNQMTEQLVASNRELGQFAYIASHDLQEPLRTIKNYIALFQKKHTAQLDDDGLKCLVSIDKASTRMQALIQDIMNYSRTGYNKSSSTIDCRAMLKEVLTDMSGSLKAADAHVHIGKMPDIQYFAEIRYVFQNLIGNAIKFRDKLKPVSIHISAAEDELQWTFSVADNGIGIEEKYFDRIFTIFQKLHNNKEYEGTGIGLAHCKKIIELHGGKIWVRSTYGSGSTFCFTIPKTDTL